MGAAGVSIPQSGFCLVERAANDVPTASRTVSIPQSGFCLVEPRCTRASSCPFASFQSLSRDSVWLNEPGLVLGLEPVPGFNPSVGILFG